MPKDFRNRPFDKLNKRIAQRTQTAPSHVLSSVPVLPSDDELFHAAMNDVREISEFRILPCAGGPKRRSLPRPDGDPDADALAILDQIAGGNLPINLSQTQEYVEWTNPDTRTEVAARMHAGQFSVQGFLDLHGCWGEEVNEEVDGFLARSFTRGWRCIKIIHGRGRRSVSGPVLKDAVIRRLLGRWRKQVIAFVSARQCDGGLGALYVMLRR